MSRSKLQACPETPLADLIVTTPYQRSVRSFKKLISPPAQKPGSELGGSLPGLVGTLSAIMGNDGDASTRSGAGLVGTPLKPVFCFNHIQIPNGFWFRVCGGHCKTFFEPWSNFSNVQERRA